MYVNDNSDNICYWGFLHKQAEKFHIFAAFIICMTFVKETDREKLPKMLVTFFSSVFKDQ